jgi:hypothetical protein
MKYVLCFGNPYLKLDNKVVNLVDSLDIPGVEFIKCKNPDDVLSYLDKDFVILDVAKGIKEPVVIEDVSKLNFSNKTSLHDFDLNFFLKLFSEFGVKVKILAVPLDYSSERIKEFIYSQVTSKK